MRQATFLVRQVQSRGLTTSAKCCAKIKYVPDSGEYPLGFLVGGTHAGIKKDGRSLDLGLIVSEFPCSLAAVFTRNTFKAAPVLVSQGILAKNPTGIRALIANSGCANAVTGADGLRDAGMMGAAVNKLIRSGDSSTFVMSTGVIGQKLPMTKIIAALPNLYRGLSSNHPAWLSIAQAICTTDTFPKLLSRCFKIGTNSYRIAGLAKGAGMIHPNMATLLGVMVTDAPVQQTILQSILKTAVDRSFNAISVDGDMSTNDTVALMANGAAGGQLIEAGSSGMEALQSIVTEFAEDLSKLIIRDGEGATKFVTISVVDANSFGDAKQIASTIARSPLVKTALYGRDANWGRILSATGYSGVPLDPGKISVSFIPSDGSYPLKLLSDGEPENVDETRASQILEMDDLEIQVSLGTGKGESARYYTCDLSHEYITINGDYRT